MGNLITTAPAQVHPIETYVNELSDHDFKENLQSTRFLKTAKTAVGGTYNIVKVFAKQKTDLDVHKYTSRIEITRGSLTTNPHALSYATPIVTTKCVLLVRDYAYSTLKQRMLMRPTLSPIDKKWITYQLLLAVRSAHHKNVRHGDIKIENVLLTSWNWVFLADFADFKPAGLPEDNPGGFSYFFDTGGRRKCALAPERFFEQGEDKVLCTEGEITPEMDVFSVGCVVAELFSDEPLFDLSKLLAYRKGEHDISASLDAIKDVRVRQMVACMVDRDPKKRGSAADHLKQNAGTLFPNYFEFVHKLSTEIAKQKTSDHKILVFHSARRAIDGIFKNLKKTEQQEAYSLVTSLVTSLVRNLSMTSTKLDVLEIMLMFSKYATDQHRLDRLLPYFVHLLRKNEPALVRASALRTMSVMLQQVSDVNATDATLFGEYILPAIKPFVEDEEELCRRALAECLGRLCVCARRFLDAAHSKFSQHLHQVKRIPSSPTPTSNITTEATSATDAPDRADAMNTNAGTDVSTTAEEREKDAGEDEEGVVDGAVVPNAQRQNHEEEPVDEGSHKKVDTQGRQKGGEVSEEDEEEFEEDDSLAVSLNTFDSELEVLRQTVENDYLLKLLVDPSPNVKESLLASDLRQLCAFLGTQRATDPLLKYILTFLNDNRSWRLRGAFFEAMKKVAPYVSTTNLVEFVLPLFEKSLADSEEFVVAKAIETLSELINDDLFAFSTHTRLMALISPLLLHPNVWIRFAAIRFVCVLTARYTEKEIFSQFLPRLKAFLKYPIASLQDPKVLSLALKSPLSRRAHEFAVCHENVQMLFEALAQFQLQTEHGQRVALQKDHMRLLDTLHNSGATQADFNKLILLEEHILKTRLERLRLRELRGVSTEKVSGLITARSPHVLTRPSLRTTTAPMQHIARVERNAYRSPFHEDQSVSTTMSFDVDVAKGITRSVYKKDLTRLIQRKNRVEGVAALLRSGDEQPTATPKRKETKRGNHPRPRAWQLEGVMVSHLHEHHKAVTRLAMAPDQKLFASASKDGSIRLWDAYKLEGRNLTNRSLFQYKRFTSAVRDIAFMDKRHTLAACSGNTITVLALEHSGRNTRPLSSRRFDPDTEGVPLRMRLLYRSNGTGSSGLYSAASNSGAKGPSSTQSGVNGQSLLAYATSKGKIGAWDPRTQRDGWELKGHHGHGLSSSFVCDGNGTWLLSATSRGIYSLWDTRFLRPVHSWLEPLGAIGGLELFPRGADSRQLNTTTPRVMATVGNVVKVWDITTPKPLVVFSTTAGLGQLERYHQHQEGVTLPPTTSADTRQAEPTATPTAVTPSVGEDSLALTATVDGTPPVAQAVALGTRPRTSSTHVGENGTTQQSDGSEGGHDALRGGLSMAQQHAMHLPQRYLTAIPPPRSAFDHYTQSRLQETEDNAVDLRQEWASLPQSTKAPFVRSAKQDLMRYEEELQRALCSVPSLSVPMRCQCIAYAPSLATAMHPAVATASSGNAIHGGLGSGSGGVVVLGGSDARIHVWDTLNPLSSYELRQNPNQPASRFEKTRRDGITYITEVVDPITQAPDALSPGPLAAQNAHRDEITAFAVSHASTRMLISADREGVIKVWK